MRTLVFVALLVSISEVFAAPGLLSADMARANDGSVIVQWRTSHPFMRVDVFTVDSNGKMRVQVGDDLTDGHARFRLPGDVAKTSGFYLVVDGGHNDLKADGIYAKERVPPLQRASNFRDLGGYVSEDGRKVRWGLIFRSAAPALLSDADLAYIDELNIRATVDLRSNEERELNPSQLAVPLREIVTMDYSLISMVTAGDKGKLALPATGGYGEFIVVLAPLYHSLFMELLKGEGAVQYHCSAGQDRTGVASALILSALGVPREQILRDYQMSVDLRKPHYEMQVIDPANHPDNLAVKLFADAAKRGLANPVALYGDDGISILAATFDMIDTRWGSIDGFLHQVIGLTGAELERLKNLYLE